LDSTSKTEGGVFKDIQKGLKRATDEFDEIVKRREKLLKDSRDVVALSSRSIISLHNGRAESAKESLSEARRLLEELRQVGGGELARYLVSPESEFVEASIMLAIERGESLPTQYDLSVSSASYLLGLLDSIGELKREVFNNVRKGNSSRALNMFEMMETLYSLAYPFAVYDNVVNGVKRKLDVARALIEDTRLIVTEETRRKEFIKTLEKLFSQGVEKAKRVRAKS
jgi:translin